MAAEREERFLHEGRRLFSMRRDGIAERWYAALAPHAFSPFAVPDILAHLGTLVERSVSILTEVPFVANTAEGIGAALVRLRYLDPAVLRETILVFGEELGRDTPEDFRGVLHERLPAFLGAVAAGHERAAHALLLEEQEGVRAALFAERERLTTTLRESEARFRTIFENAPIGITLAALDGHALEWNPAVERILGYNRVEMSRLLFTDITHPDDIVGDRALYERLVTGERNHYHKQKRYRHKQGHIVFCNLTASLLRDTQGAPRYVLGMIEDVTSQKCSNPEPPRASHNLTDQERVVLQRLAEGLTREQVQAAEAMGLRTVNRVVATLEKKLDAPNVFVLGVRAAQLGLLPTPNIEDLP